ncbi:hypothetical protein NL676_027783 [Syzygium grande]|nr:hypothetical protein NL676_027783 [Syzygium grande]
MDIVRKVAITLRVLWPPEDASTLPEDRENRQSGIFSDRFTRTRFFMLRRGNFRRSLDDLLSVKQRLLHEASHVIADCTAGPCITLQGQSVDCIFMHSALHLQNVLRGERYLHPQNMLVEMACKIIMWRRAGLELLLEAAIQESIEYPGDSRAVATSQEAIDVLEKTNLDKWFTRGGRRCWRAVCNMLGRHESM